MASMTREKFDHLHTVLCSKHDSHWIMPSTEWISLLLLTARGTHLWWHPSLKKLARDRFSAPLIWLTLVDYRFVDAKEKKSHQLDLCFLFMGGMTPIAENERRLENARMHEASSLGFQWCFDSGIWRRLLTVELHRFTLYVWTSVVVIHVIAVVATW